MKIAVIRKNGIGDFIAGCVPVCNFLLEKYGNVEFHFFMSKKNASVVRLFYPNACVHIFPGGGINIYHIGGWHNNGNI